MKRDFNNWFNTFRSSIRDYKFYVDFKKVYGNVDKIKVELNILNSLIGSKNIEVEFRKLLSEYPKILKCIPILLAIRSREIYAIDSDGEYWFNFAFLLLVVICVPVLNNAKKQEVELVIIFLTEQTPVSVK